MIFFLGITTKGERANFIIPENIQLLIKELGGEVNISYVTFG